MTRLDIAANMRRRASALRSDADDERRSGQRNSGRGNFQQAKTHFDSEASLRAWAADLNKWASEVERSDRPGTLADAIGRDSAGSRMSGVRPLAVIAR